MGIVSKILAIILFGIIAALAASPLVVATTGSRMGAFIPLLVFAGVAIACFTAPTGRKAWGRGSLITGLLFCIMPLTIGAMSSDLVAEAISQSAEGEQLATAVEASLGAGLIFGASALVGLIFGAIFIILGLVLVLAGQREVIFVEKG